MDSLLDLAADFSVFHVENLGYIFTDNNSSFAVHFHV